MPIDIKEVARHLNNYRKGKGGLRPTYGIKGEGRPYDFFFSLENYSDYVRLCLDSSDSSKGSFLIAFSKKDLTAYLYSSCNEGLGLPLDRGGRIILSSLTYNLTPTLIHTGERRIGIYPPIQDKYSLLLCLRREAGLILLSLYDGKTEKEVEMGYILSFDEKRGAFDLMSDINPYLKLNLDSHRRIKVGIYD